MISKTNKFRNKILARRKKTELNFKSTKNLILGCYSHWARYVYGKFYYTHTI